MDTPLVELHNVSRSFHSGRVPVLQDVRLRLCRNDYIAVTGPSGSGKSTMLNMMSGMDLPTSGRVCFEGEEVSSARQWADLRAHRIGFVFQFFHLLDGFTVEENIEMPMFGVVRGSGERRRRVRQLLEDVGLSHRGRHQPSELSGGEAQRAALARSLANSPDLLLADEPTGNLDSHSAGEILELLEALRVRQGLSLVVVTHDPAIASRSQRQVRLLDGRIIHDTMDGEMT